MPYDFTKLKPARERKGWNQTELAERLGLTSAAVGMMEKGDRQNPETIKAYCNKVGIDLEDIVISDEKFATLKEKQEEKKAS